MTFLTTKAQFTIDYSELKLNNREYRLVQVGVKGEQKGKLSEKYYHSDQKTNKRRYMKDIPFLLFFISAEDAKIRNKAYQTESFTKDDTICSCEWDFQYENKLLFGHCYGIFHLDTLKNTFTIEKYRFHGPNLYEPPTIRTFKIISLNESELTIMDITDLNKPRHYIFRRKK